MGFSVTLQVKGQGLSTQSSQLPLSPPEDLTQLSQV